MLPLPFPNNIKGHLVGPCYFKINLIKMKWLISLYKKYYYKLQK